MELFDMLGAQSARILGVFRILAGIMFACHGAQKILGAFGGIPAEHLNALYAPFAAAIPLSDVALGAAPAVEPRRGGGRPFDQRRGDADRDTRH